MLKFEIPVKRKQQNVKKGSNIPHNNKHADGKDLTSDQWRNVELLGSESYKKLTLFEDPMQRNVATHCFLSLIYTTPQVGLGNILTSLYPIDQSVIILILKHIHIYN